MDNIVYYVTRQRRGWSVELGGVVKSGHATRDAAIASARTNAERAKSTGRQSLVRIQEAGGSWREERSFSPKD